MFNYKELDQISAALDTARQMLLVDLEIESVEGKYRNRVLSDLQEVQQLLAKVNVMSGTF
jgi:hypothetical protein